MRVGTGVGVGMGVGDDPGGGAPWLPGGNALMPPEPPDEHAAHIVHKKRIRIPRRTAHPLQSRKAMQRISPCYSGLMPLISAKDRDALTTMAQAIKQDVDVTLYVHQSETSEAAKQLVTELGEIIPQVKTNVVDLEGNAAQAAAERVDRAPTIVMGGAAGKRVRFVGFPSGYEAASFVQSLFEAGGATEELPQQIVDKLGAVVRPVDMKVFVTPT